MNASSDQHQISDPRHAVRLNAAYLRRYIQARDSQSLQEFLGESEERFVEQFAELQSALFLACQEGFAEAVRLLIQKGANVNDSDDFGATPLHFAVFGNHPEIVEELLKAKANFTGWNRDGESLLHWAAAHGHDNVLRTLLQRGANLLAVDSAGRYAIHVACKEGHVAAVSVLIGGDRGRPSTSKEGADLDKRRRRRQEVGLPYNVDVVDKNGWTPLHYACTSFAPNFEQVVHLLLTSGADPLVQTRNGKTALHLAFDCGRDVLFQDSLELSQLLRLLLITDDLRMHAENEQPDLEEEEEEESESEYMTRVRRHYSFLQDDFTRLSKRRSQCNVVSGMCPRQMFDLQSMPLIWKRIVVNDDTELLTIMRDAFCRESDTQENAEIGFQQSFDLSDKDLSQIHQLAFENGLGVCSYAKGRFRKLLKQENPYESIYEVLTGHPRSQPQSLENVRLFRPISHSVLFVALLSGRLKVTEMLVRMRQYDLLPAALIVIIITRAFAREKVFTVQVQTLLREFADKIEHVASDALNHIFLNDNSPGRRASISFISWPLSSFGGKSVVDLAAQGFCSYFLSLPCCQVVLYNLWEGEVRSSPLLHMAALAFFPLLPCLVPALTHTHRPQSRKPSHCMIKNFDLRNEGAITLSRLNTADATVANNCQAASPSFTYYLRAMKKIASYPASKFLHFFIFHMIFLICFSYVLLYDFHFRMTVLEIWCFIYIGGYALEVFRRICQRIRRASTMPLTWQVTDVSALIMALSGFVVRLTLLGQNVERDSREERIDKTLYIARLLLLTALLAFYIRSLFIFSAWRSLGPKLDMMSAMIKRDLLPMLTIFLLFLIAFGVIFQGTLFPNGFMENERQDQLTIFLNVIRRAFYGMMAAEYDLENLNGDCKNCTTNDRVGRYLTMFVYKIIFTLIVNLILVNLLIALYSHTVAQINERSTAHWQANIYNLVAEFRNRSALPPPLNVIAIFVEFVIFLSSKTCVPKRQKRAAITVQTAKQFLVIQAFALKGRRYALGPSSNQQVEQLQKRLANMERRLKLLKVEIGKIGSRKMRSRFDRRVVQETT